jgi:hypothetical protein
MFKNNNNNNNNSTQYIIYNNNNNIYIILYITVDDMSIKENGGVGGMMAGETELPLCHLVRHKSHMT